MLQKTTWRPDTCGCVLEYEWDDAVSENERTHAISKVVHACEFHKDKPNKEKHFEDVLAENQGKNRMHAKILNSGSSAVEEVTQEDGSVVKKLKAGKEFRWSFDANRNLEVDLVGFTTGEKNHIKSINDDLKVKIK